MKRILFGITLVLIGFLALTIGSRRVLAGCCPGGTFDCDAGVTSCGSCGSDQLNCNNKCCHYENPNPGCMETGKGDCTGANSFTGQCCSGYCGSGNICRVPPPPVAPTNTLAPGQSPAPTTPQSQSCNSQCQSYAGQNQCENEFGGGGICSWRSSDGCCSCPSPCNVGPTTPPQNNDVTIGFHRDATCNTTKIACSSSAECGGGTCDRNNDAQGYVNGTYTGSGPLNCKNVIDNNNGSWKGYYNCGWAIGQWNYSFFENETEVVAELGPASRWYCEWTCGSNWGGHVGCPSVSSGISTTSRCNIAYNRASGELNYSFYLHQKKIIGGKVIDSSTGLGIGNVQIDIFDQSWGATTTHVTTTPSGPNVGTWSAFIARPDDIYYVWVNQASISAIYNNTSAKTTTLGWTWQQSPPCPTAGDQPVGSLNGYNCQKAGTNDCAGPDGSGTKNRCNFSLDPAKKCTITLPPGPITVYKDQAKTVTATIVPTGGNLTGVSGTLTNTSAGTIVTMSGPTYSPALPTSLTEAATFTLSAPRISATGSTLVNVTCVIDNVVTYGPVTTIAQIVDPETTFFAASGGDVIVNDNLGTNFPYEDPPPYFIEPANGSGIPGMAFGVREAGWYGTLPLTEQLANINQWLVDTKVNGWDKTLNKPGNGYAAMKLRLLNKVGTPVTYNSGTDLTPPALQNDSADAKVNGVVVMIADATVNLSAINVGTGKVILLVDGDVNVNGEIHRDAGGFLAILARGNITIAGSVGSTDVDITGITPHLEGIFFAGGTFNAGTSATNRLKINGTVIGMTSVDLSGRKAKGEKPTIYFNFQPDLTATLNSVGLRQKTFQELLAP